MPITFSINNAIFAAEYKLIEFIKKLQAMKNDCASWSRTRIVSMLIQFVQEMGLSINGRIVNIINDIGDC